jgi:hypothetical protein
MWEFFTWGDNHLLVCKYAKLIFQMKKKVHFQLSKNCNYWAKWKDIQEIILIFKFMISVGDSQKDYSLRSQET